MKIFDTFSKRQKLSRGEVPDVYQHETIPGELRVQIFHIWKDAFGDDHSDYTGVYKAIHEDLCREYGVFILGESNDSDFLSVTTFLFETEDIERVMDVIELSFKYIDKDDYNYTCEFIDLNFSPDEAIAELNNRFQEHGVGYQYESGQIIQVDSQTTHSEITQPALKILSDPIYEGANAEFLSAHEHYRKKRYKECLNDCLKSFESCLKTICEKREWAYNNRDTANRLIEIVFKYALIPNFMQSHFSALRSTLEAGVPPVRNQLSAHGQGPKVVTVPEHIAGYVLHLTASNILLLAQADEEMK